MQIIQPHYHGIARTAGLRADGDVRRRGRRRTGVLGRV